MSELKVEKLLGSMSTSEKKEFGKVMDSQKRESLKKVWKILKKKPAAGKNRSKEELYPLIFGKPYQKSLDYLLRNEIRLLREQLFRFFVHKRLEQEKKLDSGVYELALLNGLLDRELFSEFEFQYKNARAQALKGRRYGAAQQMGRLYFYYVMQHREMKPELLEDLQELLLENRNLTKQFYRKQLAINQQARAAIVSISRFWNKEIPAPTVGADTDFTDIDEPFTRFYEAMARANLGHHQEKVQWAQVAVAAATEIKTTHPKPLIDGLGLLALAHFALREYETAHIHFQEVQEFADSQKIKLRIEVLFNYCSTLMKLGEFQKAIALIEDRLPEIHSNPRVRFRFECLHCFCYVYLKDEKTARSLLPTQIQTRAQSEYQYFRFIYCILPYLREEYEDGLRETVNFAGYFNRHQDSLIFAKEKEMVMAFKHFYQAILAHTHPQDLTNRLSSLLPTLQEFREENPAYRDYLYVVWLVREIERLISANAQSSS